MNRKIIYGFALTLLLVVIAVGTFWQWAPKSWAIAVKSSPLYSKYFVLTGQFIQRAEPNAYVLDSHVGIKLKPYTKFRYKTPFFDISVTTNSDGFTGREYHLDKSEYRIAILGDSAVEAYGVTDENRFTSLTEQMIYNKSSGKKSVEVMGFGVSGWGPVHQYGCIKQYVLKYKPDEIWLTFMSSSDFGDDSPLLNAPPIGPTFVYKDKAEQELLDIRFGYPSPPQKMNDLRAKRYGQDLLNSVSTRWMSSLYPYFFSTEHDPTWDLVEKHTYQTFALVKKLADKHNIKLRVVYRNTGYESDEKDFQELKASALKALGRDIGMQRHTGRDKFKAQMQKLGITFVDAGFIHSAYDETDVSKHVALADYLSDYLLKEVL